MSKTFTQNLFLFSTFCLTILLHVLRYAKFCTNQKIHLRAYFVPFNKIKVYEKDMPNYRFLVNFNCVHENFAIHKYAYSIFAEMRIGRSITTRNHDILSLFYYSFWVFLYQNKKVPIQFYELSKVDRTTRTNPMHL